MQLQPHRLVRRHLLYAPHGMSTDLDVPAKAIRHRIVVAQRQGGLTVLCKGQIGPLPRRSVDLEIEGHGVPEHPEINHYIGHVHQARRRRSGLPEVRRRDRDLEGGIRLKWRVVCDNRLRHRVRHGQRRRGIEIVRLAITSGGERGDEQLQCQRVCPAVAKPNRSFGLAVFVDDEERLRFGTEHATLGARLRSEFIGRSRWTVCGRSLQCRLATATATHDHQRHENEESAKHSHRLPHRD